MTDPRPPSPDPRPPSPDPRLPSPDRAGGADPGRPEERPVGRRRTLRDIADEAGVSTGLVSMILAGKAGPSPTTAARVLGVADRLGYRVDRTASQLARRRRRSIGILMTPGSRFHAEVVAEIQARARPLGYEVLLGAVTRGQDEAHAIDVLVGFRCEALVLLGPALPPHDLGPAIGGIPAVCVGMPLDLDGVDVVRAADTEAMAMLVDHLVASGHRRIAHVDGGRSTLPALRRTGYEMAMRRHGLPPLTLPGGPTEEDGVTAAEQFLLRPGTAGPVRSGTVGPGPRRSGPTAVIAYNDMCAVGVVDALERHGIRVPEQVSVTGFDDDRFARLRRIDLTTIHPSPTEQGRLALTTVLERLDQHRTQRVDHVVTPRLVVRGTTGPAPSDNADRGIDAHTARGATSG